MASNKRRVFHDDYKSIFLFVKIIASFIGIIAYIKSNFNDVQLTSKFISI